ASVGLDVRGVTVGAGFVGTLDRGDDLLLGRVSTDPAGALDGLAGLQILVDREEVLDLQTLELIHVVNVTQVFLSWVRCRNAQQLVVTARFVTHTEHADGASADETARERRSLKQDE